MNPLLVVALFVLLAALQGALAQALVHLPVPHPELVVLAAISAGLLNGPRGGAAWGVFGGLLLDLTSAGPLGASAFPLGLVGFLSGFGDTGALRSNRLLPLQAGFVGTVVFGLLRMLLLLLSGWGFNWIVAIYEVVLPAALVSLPFVPVVYGLLYWLRRRSRSRPEIGW